MNQSYNFLIKANKEADLQDFCNYLVEPILKLDSILQKAKDSSLQFKTKTETLDIYLKIDSILNVHLPEIVNNFCDFPFEFRNTKKIKLDQNFLTPKEILLKNTAKIIEEINLIEEQFNSFNVNKTLVLTKVLANKGMQPQISLNPDKLLEKNSISLQNQFDYSDFKENNSKSIDDLIKKPSLDKSIETDDTIEDGETEIPFETGTISSKKGLTFIEIALVLSFISISFFGIIAYISNNQNNVYEINTKEFSNLISSNNYYTTTFDNWGFAIDKKNGFSYAYKLDFKEENKSLSSSNCYMLNTAFNNYLSNKFTVKVNGLDSTFSNACNSNQNITFAPIPTSSFNSETTFLEFNNYLKENSLSTASISNSKKNNLYSLNQINSVMTSKDYNTFTYSNWSFSFNKKAGFSYLYKTNFTSLESCSILGKKFKMLESNYSVTGSKSIYDSCLSNDTIILSPKKDYDNGLIESLGIRN